MHTREMMKNVISIMATQMHKILHEQVQKQPNGSPDFESQVDKKADEMLKNLPTDELIDAMIPVYQKHFMKDANALVAFSSGSTGQKVVKEMPAIAAESMQPASGVIQKTMAKTAQVAQDEVAQAQKADEAKSNDGESNKPSPSTPN